MKRAAPAFLCIAVLTACSDTSPTQTSPLPTPWSDPVESPAPPPEPTSWIVLFTDETQDPVEQATRILSETGGSLVATYGTAVKGFAAEIPEEAVQGIRSRPNVQLVERDGVVSAIAFDMVTESAGSWGIDRIDQRDLGLSGTYNYNTDGSGVTAYIMDSGIRTTHSEFSDGQGGTRAWRSAQTDFVSSDPRAGYDCHGHGTHVAGTVGGNTYGVAKNVELVGVRVLGCDGYGYYSWMISAIDWLTARHEAGLGPSVVNMSIGGGFSSSLNNAIAQSTAKGVVYAVAAGNDNADACSFSPASAAAAMTVAASTSSDGRSSFSNYGSCTDLFAPGSGIKSSTNGTDTSTGTWSGTSMATPHVAGVAVLFLGENPWASAQEVMDGITGSATQGRISGTNGSPNRLLYAFPAAPPAPTGADLRVGLVESADPIQLNGQVVYTATVTNDGPEDAVAVELEQILPGSAIFVSVTTSQGSCSQVSGTVNCSLQALGSGGAATVQITVGASQAGPLTTQSNAWSATEDPDLSDNSAWATTTVEAPPEPIAVASVGTVSTTVSGKFTSGSVSVSLDAARSGVTIAGAWYKNGDSSPFKTTSSTSGSDGVAVFTSNRNRNVSQLNFCVTALSGSGISDSTSYPVCDPDFGSPPSDPGPGDPPPIGAPSGLSAVFSRKGGGRVELTWTSGGGSEVDIYRGISSGSLQKITTTGDNGRYNDKAGSATDYYQVCVAGTQSQCTGVVPAN